MMRRRAAPWIMAGLLAACMTAPAQTTPSPSPPPPCPASGRELPPEALYGRWEARIDGQPGVAELRLARHPEYAGVRGTVTRGGDGAAASPTVAQLAGDIDDEGLLGLDESIDGHAISGVWLGAFQPGACGRRFEGTWRHAADDSAHPFVMHKTDDRP